MRSVLRVAVCEQCLVAWMAVADITLEPNAGKSIQMANFSTALF